MCAFLMACYTGMRTGEVFALMWDDIDLKNRIIKINKTVYCKKKDNKGRWFLGATKTTGSCREVLISETLYKIICKYKERQKLLKKKYGRKYKKYELEPIKKVNVNVKLVYKDDLILNINSPCLLKFTFRKNELINLEQIE